MVASAEVIPVGDENKVDVELRHLRYFVAVAEELSISRAAERLHLSQPTVTRQIRRLEDGLGVKVLVRRNNRIELTQRGVELLAHARQVLGNLESGVEETQRVARGEAGTLRLGFHVGAALELTAPILRTFRASHPAVRVEFSEYGWQDSAAGVRTGATDLSIVRLPIELDGLTCDPLFSEPVVVLVNHRHPLADCETLTLADIAAERMVSVAAGDAVWRRFWSGTGEDDGDETGPRSRSYAESIETVAAGTALALAPASAARWFPHPSLRYIPLEDGPRSTVALVRPSESPEPAGERFVATAAEVRRRERKIVSQIEQGEAVVDL
jgi:DNA-binding transcriptional LysR family regulator